jgi:hypothetical protein
MPSEVAESGYCNPFINCPDSEDDYRMRMDVNFDDATMSVGVPSDDLQGDSPDE